MNIFKKYIAYLKDNPKGYWFKRKIFGWGWTPATWQGWLVTGVFVAFILYIAVGLDHNPTEQEATSFFIKFVVSIIVFLVIAYKKGEKPKWMWGFPKNKN